MPFKEKENDFSPCDKNGNILKYVAGSRVNGYYINEQNGEKHDKAFMLINGKAFDKFARTKETDKYKEVESKEVYDLLNPKMYMVECDRLVDELRANEKALKFGLSFGGKKTYMAYIWINPLYNCLMMSIGTTKISEQMLEIAQQQKAKQKLKEVSLIVEGIDKAKVEDLIEI